ncbi:Fc.00g052400.m01.CDS01 [Cosmosporella sp. VM-42]
MKRRGPARPALKNSHSKGARQSTQDNVQIDTARLDDPALPEEAIACYQDRRSTKQAVTSLYRMSDRPFELDPTESLLLDRYIQRFSRTYPTCSGPANPFLRVFLPLSMQSRVVLDSVLALSGVQSWENGSFAMGHAMLRLRQRALRGCQALVAGFNSSNALAAEEGSSSSSSLPLAIQSFVNGDQNIHAQSILQLLASCILFMLFEKLAGEGEEDGSSHLQFFAGLLPGNLFVKAMIKACSPTDAGTGWTEASQFLSNLFLYNDLVRSTSFRTSTLSGFYLEETTLSHLGQAQSHKSVFSQGMSRFYFPRLITRISAGDLTVTDAEITAWDGSLGWLPSFALMPPEEQDEHEKIPIGNHELITGQYFQRLDSIVCPTDWSEQGIISELYRIAAVVYRKQCAAQHQLEAATTETTTAIWDGCWTGNLPSWGAQLVHLLPQGSVFENTLLWPIGIIAKELTASHDKEREYIISKLRSLEERFQMKNFGRVREHLIKCWMAGDLGIVYEDNERILFG